MARSTASGFNGSSVRRTPIASSIALAIAGETAKVPDSPTPLAPNGPSAVRRRHQFRLQRRDIVDAGDFVVGERGIGDLAAVEFHLLVQGEADLHDGSAG